MSAAAGGMSLLANLPALQVAVPLIAAPLCTFLRFRNGAWGFALLVSAVVFWMAWTLLQQVLDGGTISYHMGGWAPPIGIEYRVDRANAFVLLIVATISLITLPFAKKTVEREVPTDKHHLFYSAWLLCVTGLLGIAITGDAFNVFVFLEISSLSSYVLIAAGRDPRALTASFQYLVLGTLGATFILIGVGLLYIMTGTLNMVDLADRIPDVADTNAVRAAFAFIVIGIGLKLALFPLHRWLPGAYTNAPSAVTIFLAATATKVAVYVLLRMVFTVFGLEFALSMPYREVFFVLGTLGILFASISAIDQPNVKRMLAYSSVAQIGYIALAISLVSVDGVAAGLVHIFNHALMKGALFMAAAAIIYRLGADRIEDLAGLARSMPWTMLAFVLAGLSMIGVPLTAGFISKWALIAASINQGNWIAVIVVLVGSLLALLYIGRVAEAAYLKPAPERKTPVREAPLALLAPMYVLIAANFWFGIDTRLTLDIATRGAEVLVGGAP